MTALRDGPEIECICMQIAQERDSLLTEEEMNAVLEVYREFDQ